ncbi:MAG: hypothetical protein ABR505_04360 [Actinomycetota bacterium]
MERGREFESFRGRRKKSLNASYSPSMVASATVERRQSPLPAPGAFLIFLVLGVGAVLTLPAVADAIPHPGRPEQAQYAATCLGVLTSTCIYVYLVARGNSVLGRAWISWTLVYGGALAIVKFILSPTAFQTSSGASLGAFVGAGLVVMPLYLGALGLMYVLAVRRRGEWPFSSKLGVGVGLALVAVATRFVVAFFLGTSTQYLEDLVGVGLILPLVVCLASLAVMESFDRARASLRTALNVGIAVVIAQHLLWTIYMYRLFP